ncbi:GDA1/CD39 nucleoside phosphatase family protein [Rhynchospora pubera]|uniref:GDA1/CD39 nucleoside phosphatase family protein n=1 Tax=Rhynchospora pubera TaxID=906938 RepID=A0AAV8GF59_9POAL|nr:GDA1/CD39 nucleoside phosphatase family protein [Rhynchospora pubera]
MRRAIARSKAPDSTAMATTNSSKPRVSPPSSSKRHKGCSFLLLCFSLVIGFLIVHLFFTFSSRDSNSRRYSVIIDAGSTGSRVHVIGYRLLSGAKAVPVSVDFGISGSKKVVPGLSAFALDPDNAGKSLIELIDFAEGMVEKDLWDQTEIRLMATAGLRLLDSGTTDRILDSCRKVLRLSGFVFEDSWASVISGAEEGIYAWVAANYAMGTLGGNPKDTTGIFELGGASAQVTFVSNEPLPEEFLHVVKFGEIKYNLYTHSFLHLGQNVAYESLHDLLTSTKQNSAGESIEQAIYRDPCTPRGYLHGAKSFKLSTSYAVGNYTECRSAAYALLQQGKDKCAYPECHIGSAFIPRLNGRFLATENFFHTSKFFGLGRRSFLSELILAGEQFCSEDWSKLKRKYQLIDEKELLLYCFSSAYIVALLHDSLGISLDDERVDFANKVGNVPVDWALGAFVMLKASTDDTGDQHWVNFLARYDLSGVSSLLFFPMLLVFAACSILRCKKPQFKTIYDLEKGRYIITRIKR